MRRIFLPLLLCLVLGLSCDNGPTDLPGPKAVVVRRVNLAIQITNGLPTPIHFIVIEREALALLLWAQCTPAEESCPTIPPGGNAVVSYADIVGYDPGDDEAVLYWWMTTVVDGVPRPGAPTSVTIELEPILFRLAR